MNETELEFFSNQGISYMQTIASGGYGVIFLVHSQKYSSNFALKKIPDEYFNETEVKCLIAIDNPRIVRLYQYYKFNNFVYLLMEFCPTDLTKLLKVHPNIDNDVIFKYTYDCILAVHACHKNNIAHCDIKPSNFLIDKYGRVKISDFGLSLIYQDLDPRVAQKWQGTKVFMCPEILHKREYNPMLADIWALGCTIYYIITGCTPFDTRDTRILLHRIENKQYDLQLIKDIRLKYIIQRCLEPEPEKRITIFELLNLEVFKQFGSYTQEQYTNPNIVNTKRGDIIFKPKLSNRKSMFTVHTNSCLKGFNGMRIQLANAPSKSMEHI